MKSSRRFEKKYDLNSIITAEVNNLNIKMKKGVENTLKNKYRFSKKELKILKNSVKLSQIIYQEDYETDILVVLQVGEDTFDLELSDLRFFQI